jgi:hypothetical protein
MESKKYKKAVKQRRKMLSEMFSNKHMLNWYAADFSGHPVIVAVWDKCKAMNKFIGRPDSGGWYLGLCDSSTMFGTIIHLNLQNMGAGILSHELYHAAYFHNFHEKNSEEGAEAFGTFSSNFWTWYYDNFTDEK